LSRRAEYFADNTEIGSTGGHSDVSAGLVNAYRAVILLNGNPVGKDDDEQAKQ